MRTVVRSQCLVCVCKQVWKLVSCFRSWKNLLIVVLFTALVVTVLAQWYATVAGLQHLLEYNFAESPPRRPSISRATVFAEAERNRTTNGSAWDDGTDYFEPSKCPRSIASLPNYSQWFRERFKPNIKLFLDKQDGDNIVKNLSFYELPFGFKKENNTLISTILHHDNFKNPPSNLRRTKNCVSCAVVGSGGILNGSHAGQEIDSHDYVFRLNNALTYGRHAVNVGRRTDFYMFFPESSHLEFFKNENLTLLYTIYKSFDVGYAAEMLKINRQITRTRADPAKVKIIHPDFFRYVFAKFLDGKSMKPTTGAMLVLLAVHLCDSVTIYGFGYDPRYTMHYYDWRFTKRTYKSTWTHDVDNEKKLWNKLHEEGALRFFKRDIV